MVRRLMAEFGDDLTFTYVMGGLAREWKPEDRAAMAFAWMEQAERSRMPFDPLIWRDAPPASSYPACMGVKAAQDQDAAGRYLRALREEIVCFRHKLDTPDALTGVAARIGLDANRFRLDLNSNAVVEAFGADLEIAREVPETARAAREVVTASGKERVPFPTLFFTGESGARHDVYGVRPYEDYRAAAEAAGAQSHGDRKPTPMGALSRFGRMATREVEEVCGLKGPRAENELWQLAVGFEVTPVRVLTGWLWEADAY